eukprot:2892649-Alexandrium_andersonii.AAC.1
MHDACLRTYRGHQGPAVGCPCCGPEYVTADRRGPGAEDNPHRCAVCRDDTGGPAGPEAEQWPGCGHLLHRRCADGIRSFTGGQARCPRCQTPDGWRRRGPPIRGGTLERLS